MNTELDLSGVIRKIEALLNTKGCTEAEASARTEKAQELLEKYNLDMAQIGKKEGANHHRKDTKKSGGLYGWQRDLWQAVASLNFCHYISIKGTGRGSKYEHRIIGSHVNVIATEVMAQYLQDTVERLAQEWSREQGYKSVFVREAIAFREGCAGRVGVRLRDRRDAQIRAARAKKEAEEAASTPTGTTAVTIVDVMGNEADLNNDYLRGWEPGTTAAKRREQELYDLQMRERFRAAQLKQQELDEANDVANCWPLGTTAHKRAEAKAAENAKWYADYLARASKRQRRRKEPAAPRERAETEAQKRSRLAGFYEGQIKGEDIGLDDQIDRENREKLT